MVTLVVATSLDAASVGPAAALLSMPGWYPGPPLHLLHHSSSAESFANAGGVRLLKHDRSIVEVDDLDLHWESLTGERVHEVIFLSRHAAATNRPALTIHPIGVPHLGEGEVPMHGGKAGWVGIPNARMGPWIRLLKVVADGLGLLPEFELLWKGLGLDGGEGIGNWDGKRKGNKVLFGIGGGHYVPRHMDIALKDGVWVGHLLAGYSLPMEDAKHIQPGGSHADSIGGKWKQALEVSLEATQLAFPGGVIIAHVDQKSFKGWQKNAILSFLRHKQIKIGKPADFVDLF